MNQLMLALIIPILYLVMYIIFGNWLFLLIKFKSHSILFTLLVGWFSYFFVFQIIALPCKLIGVSLNLLAIIWSIISSLIVLSTTYMGKKRGMNEIVSQIKKLDAKICFFLLIIILIQIVIIEINGYVGSPMDASYYIGDVTASVYSNSISTINPYTGLRIQNVVSDYVFENLQTHSAVICKMFRIHPLVEIKTCLTSIVIVLSNISYYEIGKIVLKGNKIKSLIMMIIIMIINLSYTSIFSTSSFFFNRTFEGKTILGNVIIPCYILMYYKMIEENNLAKYWVILLVMGCASICINMSSGFIIPVLSAVFIFILALYKRKVMYFFNYIFCMLPYLSVIGITTIIK